MLSFGSFRLIVIAEISAVGDACFHGCHHESIAIDIDGGKVGLRAVESESGKLAGQPDTIFQSFGSEIGQSFGSVSGEAGDLDVLDPEFTA